MKKTKAKELGRKILSLVLTASLVVGVMPGNVVTVSAKGTDVLISGEQIIDTISGNEVSENIIECSCKTDDTAIHATNCSAYEAPENPECTCVEKCNHDTLNVWCDVCGVHGLDACEGQGATVNYETTVTYTAINGTSGVGGEDCEHSPSGEGTVTEPTCTESSLRS